MADVNELSKILIAFSNLQIINAFIPTKLTGIGLRERVIYFVFLESAAFCSLSRNMSDVEVQKFVMKELFNSNGICNSIYGINITLNDKLVAYRLLSNKDSSAIKISRASDMALAMFARGDGDSSKNALAQLITDKTIFPSMTSDSIKTNHKDNLIEEDQPDDHPMYCVDTEQRISLGPAMLVANYLPRLSYVIGTIAIFKGSGSIKGWIAVLIIGTWWSRGAISMALQGRDAGDLPDSSVSFAIAVHWICLLSLLACSFVVFAR
jgi:hypothetical protein